MALCAMCQRPCRGHCGKCGARLCVAHRPASSRARCPICATARRIAGVSISMPVLASTSLPSVPLALLSVPEQLQWIELAREQLLQKQARERTYLDRRAARGTHTPTDDAYEADQLLENHLLEALDLLRDCLSDVPAANMSSPNNTLLLQLAPPDYPQPKP